MLLPSLIVYAIHFYAYNRTNHREMPTVDRLFGGVNLLMTGLVAFVALIVACQLLFQKKSDAETARLAWSVVITYSLAWIGQGLLFARLATLQSNGTNTPAAMPPSSVPAPPA
jgi:predicted metal-binding membrane protein